MNKATVILGAGASAGVWNGTTPLTNKELRPPIARELFDERFWEYRSRHLGAEVLGAELGPLAQKEDVPFDLEARLTEYRDSVDPATRRHFKDIAPYLRDLLVGSSAAYTPSPGNYLRLVSRLLRDKTHEVMFVSLNYDTMLENALAKYDAAAYTFNAQGEYMAEIRQAKIAKFHGSTSWGIPLYGTAPDDKPKASWKDALSNLEHSAGPTEDFAIVDSMKRTGESWRAPVTKRLLYPVLTAPVVDKTGCCPAAHIRGLKDFLLDCHKFLVIGTSGIDKDLLHLLAETSLKDRGYLIYYVSDTESRAKDVRHRFEEELPPWRPSGPRSPLPREYGAGFKDFLDTTGVEDFLAAS